ncbi:MAG: hypothetical protein CK425_08870 [Parachlamydia sp.]|nr:MAG: hypothetical protein CK425_08870 [Parachlamydia sp.]
MLKLERNLIKEQFVFEEPPENFQPKIEVAGCFICVGEDFLFLKQQPNDSEANTWGVPGGKIGKTESAEASSMREVYEETGIDLNNTPLRFLGKVYIRYPEMDFFYSMFEASLKNYPAVVIDPAEHTEYRWMTLETTLELPLIRGKRAGSSTAPRNSGNLNK